MNVGTKVPPCPPPPLYKVRILFRCIFLSIKTYTDYVVDETRRINLQIDARHITVLYRLNLDASKVFTTITSTSMAYLSRFARART